MSEQDFKLTPHASRRMLQRGISRGEVGHVLQQPSLDLPANRPGRRKLTAAIPGSGRRITVVVKEGTEPPLIISMWVKE